MKYREQYENCWPSPEELRECRQVKSHKPPSGSWMKTLCGAIAFMAGAVCIFVSVNALLVLMGMPFAAVLFTVFLAPICFLLALGLVFP